MIEVEDKFRVHADFELPRLDEPDGPVTAVSRPRRATLSAAYHDTPDLRLARAGVTLRHRSGEGRDKDGWQLKLPVTGAAAGVREELHVSGAAGAVPRRLRELVTAYVRTGELAHQALLKTERTTIDLYDPDGEALAEVVDDQVDALSGDHHVARFREIEVEDRGGGSRVLDHVGALLRDAGAVAGEFQPKVVRALGAQASAPSSPPEPQRPRPRDPARVLVAGVLRQHVRGLLDHDPWVRLDADDAVHQMRVSARRLRSALRDLGPLVDQEWADHLGAELRWLGGALSGRRDAEVMRARLRDLLDQLPDDLVASRSEARLGALLDTANEGGDPAHEALTSARYVDLLEALVDGATHPRTTDLADRPCADVLPALLRGSWKRLSKRASRARGREPGAEAYHRTRKAAKRTRYLLEAVIPVYGKPAKRLAGRVEDLQDLLGEHQDTVVTCDLLRRAALEPRVGRTAFTFGLLHAHEQRAAGRAARRFDRHWAKTARLRHRRWLPA